MISDALFESYAAEEEAAATRASRNGNFEARDYEEIKWVGCETSQPTIFRAVGGPPNSNIDETTAKTVTISWVIDDNGKKMKLIRPSSTEDNSYIINKIMAKVLSPKWVNQQKTFPVKDQHPDIYNLITKNGVSESDKRFKYEKGWQGKEVIIMNVIDREDMAWHRANKHTKLLAKSVQEAQNGGEFVDEGISSYAIQAKLSHLFRSYGSWEKYDIAITRTSKMDNPYLLVNATRTPEEVNRAYQQYISSDSFLTEEEKSWEKYDIAKIYKPTSPIKLFNRLKNTIKRIDAALGTSFYEELDQLAKAEKERLEKESPKETHVATPITEVESSEAWDDITIPTAAPVREAAAPIRTRSVTAPWQLLPHGNTLSDELKAMVSSVASHDGKYDIEWTCDVENLAACPECGAPSPIEATCCPACGVSFG